MQLACGSSTHGTLIAAEASQPLHAYGTDEDNWLGPYAVDPLTSAWELGSEPVRYAAERAALVARVQPELEKRMVSGGDGYQRLRGATANLLFERLISMLPVTKTVGGLYFARDHKGDPNGRPPFTPVSAEKQREAVKLIVDNAISAPADSDHQRPESDGKETSYRSLVLPARAWSRLIDFGMLFRRVVFVRDRYKTFGQQCVVEFG